MIHFLSVVLSLFRAQELGLPTFASTQLVSSSRLGGRPTCQAQKSRISQRPATCVQNLDCLVSRRKRGEDESQLEEENQLSRELKKL